MEVKTNMIKVDTNISLNSNPQTNNQDQKVGEKNEILHKNVQNFYS